MSRALDRPGRVLAATLALAFASYASLYPVMLLPAVVLLLNRNKGGAKGPGRAVLVAVLFGGLVAGLVGLSVFGLEGSWEFIHVVYWEAILCMKDLTPTMSLWQPIFVAMFDRSSAPPPSFLQQQLHCNTCVPP